MATDLNNALGGMLSVRAQQQREHQIGLQSVLQLQNAKRLQQQFEQDAQMAPVKQDYMRAQAEHMRNQAAQAQRLEEAISQLPKEVQPFARLAPGQFVGGQFRNPNEGKPDIAKLHDYRDRLDALNTPEAKKKAEEVSSVISRRTEGDKEFTAQQLIAQGMNPDVARQVAYGLMKIVPTADGGVQMIRTDKVDGGAVASGATPQQAPQQIPQVPQPGGMQSPYDPTPRLPGSVGGVAGPKPAQLLYEETQQLSKRVDDKKIPMLDKSMEALDGIFSKYEVGKVPGIGYGLTGNPVAGAVYGAGSAMGNQTSKDAQDVRGQLKRWTNMITRASAGLSQTVTETANVLSETMTKPSASEADVRSAYENWKQAYLNDRASTFAGADPRVVSEFTKRTGRKATFMANSDEEAQRMSQELYGQGVRNFEVKVSKKSQDKFEVGKTYTDGNGRKAKYMGQGQWQSQ